MAETKRATSPGAEKWLGVEQKVLNDGHVVLVDYMGTDEQNIGIARISHGAILPHETPEKVKSLTNYLMKNRHTSPFEFVEMTWKERLPIFVARQFIRHRTSNVNEKSARYAQLDGEVYVPDIDEILGQDTKNRQGSSGELPDSVRLEFREYIIENARAAKEVYFKNTDPDNENRISLEMSRTSLTLGTYTDWVWKQDMHNTLHLLGLRLDGHAQSQTRKYAEAKANVIMEAWPIIWGAFEEHVLRAMRFSRTEMGLLKRIILLENAASDKDCVALAKRITEFKL
jgi:thymidylate synthase (FAD)